MKKFATALLLFCICFMAFGQAATNPATPAAPAPGPSQKYELKVKIGSGPVLTTIVTIDQPFTSVVKPDGGGFYAISGVVLPPEDKKYPVALSIFEWWSEKSNSILSSKPSLTLGEPAAWGVSGGAVRNYSVTLTPIKEKKP